MFYIIVLCSHILGDDFPNVASLLETVLELQAERELATASRSNQDNRPVLPSSTPAASVPGW